MYYTIHKLKISYDIIGCTNLLLLNKIEEMSKTGDSIECIQTAFNKLKSETIDKIEELSEDLNLNK